MKTNEEEKEKKNIYTIPELLIICAKYSCDIKGNKKERTNLLSSSFLMQTILPPTHSNSILVSPQPCYPKKNIYQTAITKWTCSYFIRLEYLHNPGYFIEPFLMIPLHRSYDFVS